ncbi:DUF4230 domain-containing protein [Muricauda sp. SCSIO 64092]|uniref:DUF4230 domain-containing protein n=1 Tax=Allomuricauda sp. SCSIO 64092 TaxID=2908842 RepID=UPI001FF36944|nr:DUF4230 domain-containing protein [Muricauda sp. SCSIO 64092]UOY08124.1 DUF4230 domain-containing protein [Muricauda sp. SCSIO 64092]
MDGFIEAILGLLLGVVLTYWVYGLFNQKRRKELVQHQSTVILDKIKSVCKLVSVEGDFAEIYSYENIKEGFMKVLSSKKKALVVINAKAQVGYDLKKLLLKADLDKKRIILSEFPEPEVLSIEPDIQFYDIKNGLFNSFSSEDLTDLNAKAKEHIREKIPESGLLETAKKEALEAVLIIEKIVETIGWKLDYSALELSNREKQFLES